MKLLADMHMHTFVSGHAYGTMREMVQAASQKGLKVIGITEHGPGIPGTCHPFYFGNFEVIPRVIDGVEVYHGCEINVLNDGTLSLDEEYIDVLDYAICGIHVQCYTDAGKEKNTDNVISCMKNKKVRIVSHPDDDHTSLDYERLVKAAKKYHVALEVNNSSFIKKDRRLHVLENYKTMLELCKKEKVYIILDSDAHDPSAVGRLHLVNDFLEEMYFPKELVLHPNVLNHNIDLLKHFLMDEIQ